MPELISNAKSWTNPISFDTYVPLLSDPADITTALKLFFFGNNINGSTFDENSIYSHLIDIKELANSASISINLHINKSSNIHGIGSASVVGTTISQELTNKTLTEPYILSPKINENILLTATSSELNILSGATLTTAELNKLSGASVSTSQLNYLSSASANIQTQLNNKQATATNGLVPLGTYKMTNNAGIGFSSWFSTYATEFNNWKVVINAECPDSQDQILYIYLYKTGVGTNSASGSYSTKTNINYSSGSVSYTRDLNSNGWIIGQSINSGFTSEVDIINPYLNMPTGIRFSTRSNSITDTLSHTYGTGYNKLINSWTGFYFLAGKLTGTLQPITNGVATIYGYNK